MFPEVAPITPITYPVQRTYVEVAPGKEPGEKKYVETSYDIIIYDKGGQLDPVIRVNKVDYYA